MVLRLRDIARDPPLTRDVHQLLNGRSIVRTSRVHRLKYWGHIIRRPAQHILKKAIHYHVPGKFKHGRPCFTWNDSLQRDLQRAGDKRWDLTVHDKAAHNAKCNAVYDESATEESDY